MTGFLTGVALTLAFLVLRKAWRVGGDLIDCRRVLIEQGEPHDWSEVWLLHKVRNDARIMFGRDPL